VLRANLEILSRRNHSYIVSYVDIGTDATIAYPTTDFQFKNNRNYAIKVVASAKNGILKIDILGVKEETEYEVVIESEVTQVIPYTTKTTQNSSLAEGTQNVLVKGVNGYKSITYKILKLNGVTVSKTVLSEDTYKPMTREVEVGTKK
jgi:vancomycin resistance protein YoaR